MRFFKNRSKISDLYYFHIFRIHEDLERLNKKLDEMHGLLKDLKRNIKMNNNRKLPLKLKTKEAIKLLLRKHGKLTSSHLADLIGLSRTRCNEYLREMEDEGEVKSEIMKKRKFYFLAK